MTTPKHCEEYRRMIDRQILLALARACGARIANPTDPEEARDRHLSTCPECRSSAQARREATAPPAGAGRRVCRYCGRDDSKDENDWAYSTICPYCVSDMQAWV